MVKGRNTGGGWPVFLSRGTPSRGRAGELLAGTAFCGVGLFVALLSGGNSSLPPPGALQESDTAWALLSIIFNKA